MNFIVVNSRNQALALPEWPGATVRWVPIDSDAPLWKFPTQRGAQLARNMHDDRAVVQIWRRLAPVCAVA